MYVHSKYTRLARHEFSSLLEKYIAIVLHNIQLSTKLIYHKNALWREKENSIRHLSLSSLSFHHQYLKSALPPLKISAKKTSNTVDVFAPFYFTVKNMATFGSQFSCPLVMQGAVNWSYLIVWNDNHLSLSFHHQYLKLHFHH